MLHSFDLLLMLRYFYLVYIISLHGVCKQTVNEYYKRNFIVNLLIKVILLLCFILCGYSSRNMFTHNIRYSSADRLEQHIK